MRITIEWLKRRKACEAGIHWFGENFPHGGHRDEVLAGLGESGMLTHYAWLLWTTLRKCPLPDGWILPCGLKELYLGGGTLPEGTRLPEGLGLLHLGGGAISACVVIPAGCVVRP